MIPVEVTDESLLNYLVLVVEEGNNSGIGEVIDSRVFKTLGTYPNPFSESTTIHFGNNNLRTLLLFFQNHFLKNYLIFYHRLFSINSLYFLYF